MENEVMKLERKIRELLGNDYHLFTKYSDNLDIEEWHLHRNYKDAKIYLSEDNKEIMSSENHTLEDLYDFAKKHHRISIAPTFSKIIVYIMIGIMILCALNIIFWHNKYISTFVLGFDIAIIIADIILFTLDNKNFDVDMLELNEYFERDLKELEEKLKKVHNKNKECKKEEETKPKAKKVKKEVKNEEHTAN